jgi:hypothetical protein
MTAIYVLTEGEYSDYHIVALFSTREKAEAAQILLPDSCVEEYELDSLEIPEHPPGHTAWFVSLNARDNTFIRSYQDDPFSRSFEPKETYFEATSKHPSAFPIFAVKCWARDKEHAEKIALDKFYQWKWEREQI